MDENPLAQADTDHVHGMHDEKIHMSDVIEVIQSELGFGGSAAVLPQHPSPGPSISMVPQNPSPVPSTSMGSQRPNQGTYVKIVEQPAPKALRFRYECEGRSAGSIPGISSTTDNKTFPAIQVIGSQKRAVVVVSCVTKDEPFRPHPHNLVGRECKRGVCTMQIPPETMCVTFPNLGIQCVKKKDIENALKTREDIKVDPFLTGFNHRNQPTSIDLNAVRLCFQVFLENERTGKFTITLPPVVSDPIYDKKAMSDLAIVKLSDCNCYVDGSRKDIILLCEKVTKDDIQIRFYEERNGQVIWEGFGDFQPTQVHKQTAIWFRAPRYHTLDITEPAKVLIQLRRPSDGAFSESLPFEYLPLDSEPGRKRPKFDRIKFDAINAQVRQSEEYGINKGQPYFNIPIDPIKKEPRDKTPSPYGGQVYSDISPNHQGVSPSYVGQTPPPPDFTFQQQPPILPQQWNISSIPTTSRVNLPNVLGVQNWNHQMANNNIPGPSPLQVTQQQQQQQQQNLSCLLDLDNQQFPPIQISSGDLTTYDTNNLSETFNANLSLTDLEVQTRENMTDSLTGLVNNTIDNMQLDAVGK